MRSIKVFLLCLRVALVAVCSQVRAQSTEVQQLLLNVEKLSQMKNILQDMKKGYEVVSKGYNAVKNISQGNFSLHEVFLDGLMLVSPEVKKYRRVADIIRDQKNLVSEYKSAFKSFQSSGGLNLAELDYLGRVYKQLFDQSLNSLDELVTVITAGTLRMSDEQRLKAIDRIFADTQDKLMFLRNFNQQAMLLSQQRIRQQADLGDARSLYDLNSGL
jgi:hypothetical protein